MSRKQALAIHALMFAVLLSIMLYDKQDEKHDIAAVRVENKASIQLVLDTLKENDKAARERGGKISRSVDTLIGVVDTLTKGLYSTEPAPKGKH